MIEIVKYLGECKGGFFVLSVLGLGVVVVAIVLLNILGDAWARAMTAVTQIFLGYPPEYEDDDDDDDEEEEDLECPECGATIPAFLGGPAASTAHHLTRCSRYVGHFKEVGDYEDQQP